MLITQGGRFGGYGFYLKDSKPVFVWNLVDLKRIRWEGPVLAPGKHVLEFDFKYDSDQNVWGAATAWLRD
jgi:arylsulfatase